jgi:hypothetical protein
MSGAARRSHIGHLSTLELDALPIRAYLCHQYVDSMHAPLPLVALAQWPLEVSS